MRGSAGSSGCGSAGPHEGAAMHPFPQSGQISGAITSRCEMTQRSFVPEVGTTQHRVLNNLGSRGSGLD